MNLVIAISGCDGGNSGPRSLYHSLEDEYARTGNTRFLPMDTIPDDLLGNVQRVSDLVQAHLADYQHIYLMGYSMGGGIAAVAAAELNRENPQTIKGVVLLNSQTEGLQALDPLSIPVVFLHGKNDSYFSIDEIQDIYDKYKGPKKFIAIDGMHHNCRFDLFKNADLLALTSNLLSQLPSFEMQEPKPKNSYCAIL